MTGEERPQDPQDEEQDSAPHISLDWYKESRKRTKYAAGVHVITLVFMLAALLAIFFYKDRCGDAVSGAIFMLNNSSDGGHPGAGAPGPGQSAPEKPTK
jgi:hypothetical protein